MGTDREKALWRRLARRTARRPLIWGTPRIERTERDFRICDPEAKKYPCLAIILLGVLAYVVVILIQSQIDDAHPYLIPWWAAQWFGAILGTCISAVGVIRWQSDRYAARDDQTAELVIHTGYPPFEKTIRLPRANVAIELRSLGSERSAIQLKWSESDQPIILARARQRALITSYAILTAPAEALSRPPGWVAVTAADGRRFFAERTFRSPIDPFLTYASPRTPATISILSQNAAKACVPLRIYAATVAFAAIAVISGWTAVWLFWLSLLFGTAIAVCIALIFLAAAMAGVTTIARQRRFMIDRRRDNLTIWRPGMMLGGRKVEFERKLEDVAAVQICMTLVKPIRALPYAVFELNLVMAKPEAKRMTLLAHGTEETIRRDAENLAAFLGKPLLDHTV